MKILLEPQESEQLFHTAMCNVFGTGYHNGYGLELEYDALEYETSKKKLSGQVCFEDVLLQMLKDGKKLTLVDVEYDGEYTSSITIEDIHQKVQNTPTQSLINELEGSGDVNDSDIIIQTVFFGDIIFG